MKRGGPLKRTTRLKANAGLKRTGRLEGRGELKRTTRVKPVNRERLAKRRAEQFGEQAALCRVSPCLVCRVSPCDPAHVRSRGAGGKDADCVPLCREHHSEQHAIGVASFGEKYGLDLAHEAERMARKVSDRD